MTKEELVALNTAQENQTIQTIPTKPLEIAEAIRKGRLELLPLLEEEMKIKDEAICRFFENCRIISPEGRRQLKQEIEKDFNFLTQKGSHFGGFIKEFYKPSWLKEKK